MVNVVQGGPDMLKGILVHEGIAGVSSVDNTPVTRHIYETGAAHGKRVQAQGGVKNHIIVTESADPACAVERCLSKDVVVVEADVYNMFTNHMEREMRAMTAGSGLDDSVDVGPPISAEHLETVRGYIETGVKEGAQLIVDGRIQQEGAGQFIGPSLFGEATPEMTIAQEEHFGPIWRSFGRWTSRRQSIS